jgi:hypothetical protein
MLRILSLLSVLTLAGCATGMYNEPDAGDAFRSGKGGWRRWLADAHQ